jgi:two-component system response regulator RegX3
VLVLIVEDDQSIAAPLATGLEREGFDVELRADGEAALQRVRDETPTPDVILLDLGLPDVDGLDVCRRLRATSDVPIVVVTARSEEADRVRGLELGADDYIVKPFGFLELVARIRAITRRGRTIDTGPVRVGALSIDARTREVRVDSREVLLTPKEFELLALLAEDTRVVWSRNRILETVWDPHWYGPTKTLDVHVASLRRKLGNPEWIETVRGVGFRLRALG